MDRSKRRRLATLVVALVAFGAAGIRIPLSSPDAPADPQRSDSPLALVVNLPAHRLDVFEHGERTRSYVVTIGSRGYETPPGEYRISRAVWNPWWHPPASPWAKNERPTPPGPHNPMGRVKLYFDGLYYIHGTAREYELGEPASHGCIRMRNVDVLELARTVHRYGSVSIAEDELDRLERAPQRTRTVSLERPVPLLVTYDLAEIRDDHLVLYPDVYSRRGASKRDQARRALQRAGYALASLDESLLESLLERSRSETVVVPAAQLVGAVVDRERDAGTALPATRAVERAGARATRAAGEE
ncbi:MAG: L,D-transpeptidase [Longimicrobiales bacterium]